MGIGLFKAGPEDGYTPKLVALTNRVLPSDDSVQGITFSNIANADVHIDGAGNVVFEAVLEGDSQSTVWRYVAETGKVSRVGPGAGEPVTGFSGSATNSSWVMGMNSQGRLVIRIAGLDSEFLNLNGYFFEGPDGLFHPLAILGKPLVEGGGLVTSLEEPVLVSDSNAVAMVVRVDNIPTAYVVRISSELTPEGNNYYWDGGAGTDDWHTVVNGRSNWVDASGTPWDKAPGTEGKELVEIGDGFVVSLNQSVSIRQLDLGDSTLKLNANLEFFNYLHAKVGSLLEFIAGNLSSPVGTLETFGAIRKRSANTSEIAIFNFNMKQSSLTVESGNLRLRNGIGTFKDSPVTLEKGELTFEDDDLYLTGDGSSITCGEGTIEVNSKSVRIDASITLESAVPASTILFGSSTNNPAYVIDMSEALVGA